jgi:hypothetical protein
MAESASVRDGFMPNIKKALFLPAIITIVIFLVYPVTAYTIESSGKKSYDAVSGTKINYSINSGAPAHKLIAAPMSTLKKGRLILGKESQKGEPSVQAIRVPYSFQQGPAVPYSMELPGVTGVREGYKTKKAPAVIGKTGVPTETVAQPSASETVTQPAAPETVAPAIPAEQPKFTIEGIVYDDAEGNGLMDNSETGLANWTVNLEQPAGTVINTATTDATGKFAFADQAAGEYIVYEVLQMGWNSIAPADGKIPVVITNESMTTLQFANQMIPLATAAAPEVVPMNETWPPGEFEMSA